MSQLPPPPPGSDVPPPPGEDLPPPPAADFGSVPPPEEVHENDVLKRRKKFSWRNFGGDGFLVSVAFHVILAIIAIFLIIGQVTGPKKKEVPEEFATGSGGGNNGEKAKSFETKLKQRNPQPMKTPSRIVSKSAGAVSLPDTPATATQNFASGLASGDMSKGSGGGTGGGIGTGNGIGVGNGRNFVSLFGGPGFGNNRLAGYIYDFSRNLDGKPGRRMAHYSSSNNCPWLDKLVSQFVQRGWPESMLEECFRGPVQLGVHQILIPCSKDTAAPAAFEAEGKMSTGAWIAVYRGKVRAPESGEIRFCGNADNYIGVRFAGKNVLFFESGDAKTSVFPLSPSKSFAGFRLPTAYGKWIQVTKGAWYDIDVLIGDAGGVFSALLFYERKSEPGKKIMFHTEAIPWDDVIKLDTGAFFHGAGVDLPRDLDPASPVWLCKAASAARVR